METFAVVWKWKTTDENRVLEHVNEQYEQTKSYGKMELSRMYILIKMEHLLMTELFHQYHSLLNPKMKAKQKIF